MGKPQCDATRSAAVFTQFLTDKSNLLSSSTPLKHFHGTLAHDHRIFSDLCECYVLPIFPFISFWGPVGGAEKSWHGPPHYFAITTEGMNPAVHCSGGDRDARQAGSRRVRIKFRSKNKTINRNSRLPS